MKARVSAVATAAVLAACGSRSSTRPLQVASVNLTCAPASTNVRCRLLALFRDVSLAPRDVTSIAVWHLSGVASAYMAADGLLTTPPRSAGDLELDAEYASHHARVYVRVTGVGPGQMLASLRGHVYVEEDGSLEPVASAHLEVIGGASPGRTATTDPDGSYQFVLAPGEVVVRATKLGYSSADGSLELWPGENRLSLLIEPLPVTIASRRR